VHHIRCLCSQQHSTVSRGVDSWLRAAADATEAAGAALIRRLLKRCCSWLHALLIAVCPPCCTHMKINSKPRTD
jgi:hypothetical protein